MDEKRFMDIETKLAHQEHLVAELNDVLTEQQAQLTRLDKLCASLAERVRSLAEAAPPVADVDERPPHY